MCWFHYYFFFLSNPILLHRVVQLGHWFELFPANSKYHWKIIRAMTHLQKPYPQETHFVQDQLYLFLARAWQNSSVFSRVPSISFHISSWLVNHLLRFLWSFWSQKQKNYLMPHKIMCLMTAPQLTSSTVLPLLCPSLPFHFHYNGTLLVPSCFLPTRGGLMTSLPVTHSLSPEKLAL